MTAGEKIAGLLAAQGTPRLRASMGAILLLAWPAIVEQLMITLVQYVDTAMVGSLGSLATAAVGLTASTTWLFGGMFNAASIGFSVQVAQHLGAGRQKQARDVTWQALRFVVIFGLLLGGIAFALSFPLPAMLGAEAAVRPQASLYFRIIACAMPFTLGANMCSAILRCAGDTKTPMVLNLMINALNVVLNFIFIYPSRTITLFGSQLAIWGAGWGVGGAAFASGCSTAVVFLLFVVVLIYKRSPVQIKWRERCGFQKECLLAVWRLGLPAALERATLCVAQIVITAVITGIGTVAVAALMTRGGALLFTLAPQLIRTLSLYPLVNSLVALVLRIVAFAEPLFGASIVASGALRGAGDSKGPFYISLATMWGVRITLSLLLAGSWGLVGVWLAMAAELCARGLIFMIRLYRGKWLHISLFGD